MKKIALILAMLLFPSMALAAGTNVYTKNTINVNGEEVEEHVWTWVADAAAATVPTEASDAVITGYVILGTTNPGAPAPTANYDITITDAEGIDVFGTTLTNRSATLSEQTRPGLAGATDFGERFVSSILTMNLTNNAVNSAVGVVKVYTRKPR